MNKLIELEPYTVYDLSKVRKIYVDSKTTMLRFEYSDDDSDFITYDTLEEAKRAYNDIMNILKPNKMSERKLENPNKA